MMNAIQNQAAPAARAALPDNWKKAFDLCLSKTHGNIKRLADEPKSAAWAEDGNYFNFNEGFFDIGNWTSSFFTGMALIAWQETEDEYYLKQVLRLAKAYREKVFERHLDTHHDLGFLASLYSVALFKLTGDREHREVALRSAEVLSQRFNEKGGFIRAWGRMDTDEFNDMAIIDCLMNLPLLYWAARESGNERYYQIAVRHADTVLKNFVRADYSVYHAYRFDLATGKPVRGDTYGGWAAESHWARGAAWAIYGFALSYGYTGNKKDLEMSERLAKNFMAQLDSEIVPLWDFKLRSDMPRVRDASASAIAVCGFQELLKYGAADAAILKAKNALLDRMCSVDYLNFDKACPGVQKNGMVGDGAGLGKNAYTSWGDYFLMEALSTELSNSPKWW